MRVLFVCLGNICRSPTAEAVFRKVAAEAGRGSDIEIDSCGLISYHEGRPPDPRATMAAEQRSYDLSTQRARPIVDDDFERFDLLLGMDDDVVRSLREMAPAASADRVVPFLGLDEPGAAREVPDPFYGGMSGFEDVLDLVEDGARALLDHVESRLDPH
ncbi:MAG: low molecular weight protein-tyrosine-phosphatase [Planctomycetota bacterium]